MAAETFLVEWLMGQKLFTSWRSKIPYRRLDISVPLSHYLMPPPKKRRNWQAYKAETKRIEAENERRRLLIRILAPLDLDLE